MDTYEPLADAPDWFRRALAVEMSDIEVSVNGCAVHAVTCGPPGSRGLVFVHGGSAHAHWWTFVAASFSAEYRVVCIDLSGHGDSQHRSLYSLEQWTDEVMAVAEAGLISGPPVIVGHSLGGYVTLATAARHGGLVSGAIVCDSPVFEKDPEIAAYSGARRLDRQPVYPDLAEALGRFRTLPPQDHYLSYVMDYVARHSLCRVEGGWQWKFDPMVTASFASWLPNTTKLPITTFAYLSKVTCRVALLRSEFGLVTPDIGRRMYDQMGRVTPVVEIPDAGHHPMLDQPLILQTSIRTLLADWEHSEPLRRYAPT